MKKLLIAAIWIPFAVARGADDAPTKPGFWERAWRSTRNGAGRVVETTKRAGEKTVDLAKAPFRKSAPANADVTVVWRDLAMTLTLDPGVVRLPDTRVIQVTVVVVNKGRRAVQLDFPTSQRIDVLVMNESGRVLSRWSDDQKVDKEPGFILVNPSERIECAARISTREMALGQSYRIEAFIPNYDRLRTTRTVTPVR